MIRAAWQRALFCNMETAPPGWISVISGWILPPVMSSAGHLVQSPSVRWSSTPLVLPLRMRCITPSVVVFMSCPFCRSRWQWQLLQGVIGAGPSSTALSLAAGTYRFAGGGRGKTTLLYQMSCALCPQRLAGARLYHHPYPLPAGRALGTGCVPAGCVVGGWNVRCGGKAAAQNKLTQPACLGRSGCRPPRRYSWKQTSAKGLPCKAPAAHEPVLLPQSDNLLAVAGLSALGRPLEQAVCFRAPLAAALLGVAPDARLTPGAAGAAALPVPQGGAKQRKNGEVG